MSKLFIFWLILQPFVVWNGSFEGPKVFYFLFGSTALLVFWIAAFFKHKKNINFVKSDYFFLLWLVALLVSSIFGVHFFESIIGGSYRHQGVIFFLALWLIGKTVGLLTKTERTFLVKGIGISVLIESILVISQFLFNHLYFGKSLGTLGEANAVAGFLAVGFYFVYQSFPKLFLIVPLIAIIFESSRSGLISFLFNLAVFGENINRKIFKPLLFLTLTISVLLVLSFSVFKVSSPFENRPLFWKMATEAIAQKPFLGFGAESDEVIYNEAFVKANMPLNNLIVDRAHNLLLDVGLWSGLVGLFIFCGWLYQIFRELKETDKKYALFSFLVYSMFQPLGVSHWILLIIIVNI